MEAKYKELEHSLNDLDHQDLQALVEQILISMNTDFAIEGVCSEHQIVLYESLSKTFDTTKLLIILTKILNKRLEKSKSDENQNLKNLKKLNEKNMELSYKLQIKEKLLQDMLSLDQEINNSDVKIFNITNYNDIKIQNNFHVSEDSMDSHHYSSFDTRLSKQSSFCDKEMSYLENKCVVLQNQNIDIINKMRKMYTACESLSEKEKHLLDSLISELLDHREQILAYSSFLNSHIKNAIENQTEVLTMVNTITELKENEEILRRKNLFLEEKLKETLGNQDLIKKRLDDLGEFSAEIGNISNQNYKALPVPENFDMQSNYNHFPSLASEIEQSIIEKYQSKNTKQQHLTAKNHNIDSDDAESNNSPPRSTVGSVFGDDCDSSHKSKPNMTSHKNKFEIVKTLEGSKMLDNWKKMATSSRGLQITKNIASDQKEVSEKNSGRIKNYAKVVPTVSRLQMLQKEKVFNNDISKSPTHGANLMSTPNMSSKLILSRFPKFDDDSNKIQSGNKIINEEKNSSTDNNNKENRNELIGALFENLKKTDDNSSYPDTKDAESSTMNKIYGIVSRFKNPFS